MQKTTPNAPQAQHMKHARQADMLIIGGGTGGCAAALAATELGCRVILTEPTDWPGGQLTSQAVPPDEHPWIEHCGGTARYRAFRQNVRAHCRNTYPYTDTAKADRLLNPGLGTVSGLCHEPRVARAVIESMLAPAVARGLLSIYLRHHPVAVETDGDYIRSVTVRHADSGEEVTFTAPYILDATELGDLLALAHVEHVSGTESSDRTAELHAPAGPAQPGNVQAITWCFPLAYDPDPKSDHTIEPPAQYARWRAYVPDLSPPWTGPLISWDAVHPVTMCPRRFELFGDARSNDFSSLWHYRRIVAADHYLAGREPHEATLVNWPQNDYFEGNLIGADAENLRTYLDEAKQLSLSLVHWLQTEAPRADGGCGYPGLYLVPEMTGSADGLAQAPYIRESRRIVAEQTVSECHIGAEARGGKQAEAFHDSVGIGYYRIDLHPSTGKDNYIDIPSMPFQIPLGALIPVRMENLLPACKNIGTTHISNGCYRLHPVEWNIGEAAGILAAFCLQSKQPPRAVRNTPSLLDSLQTLMTRQGIELQWPESILREACAMYKPLPGN